MSFEEQTGRGKLFLRFPDVLLTPIPDGSAEITFTYRMISGIAHRSFGVWVAKLAGLPEDVLDIAHRKSAAMRQRGHRNLVAKCLASKNLAISAEKTVALLGRINAISS